MLILSAAWAATLEVPSAYPTLERAVEVAQDGDVIAIDGDDPAYSPNVETIFVYAAVDIVGPAQVGPLSVDGGSLRLESVELVGESYPLVVASYPLELQDVEVHLPADGVGIIAYYAPVVATDLEMDGGTDQLLVYYEALEVRESRFVGATNSAVAAVSAPSLLVEDSIIEGGSGSVGGAILASEVDEVTIRGNQFLNQREAEDGDDITGGATTRFSDVLSLTVEHNLFCGNASEPGADNLVGSALFAMSASSPMDVMLRGNVFRANESEWAAASFWQSDALGQIFVVNNTFIGNGGTLGGLSVQEIAGEVHWVNNLVVDQVAGLGGTFEETPSAAVVEAHNNAHSAAADGWGGYAGVFEDSIEDPTPLFFAAFSGSDCSTLPYLDEASPLLTAGDPTWAEDGAATLQIGALGSQPVPDPEEMGLSGGGGCLQRASALPLFGLGLLRRRRR